MADEAGKSCAGATTSREPPSREDFDVYLSFRGADTRFTVAHVLYNAFLHAGVRVFVDSDEGIRRGEDIRAALMGAIAKSTIYIPIFSRNYASSRSCLRELAEMVKCWKASKEEKAILPIFYDIDPSDVRLETNLYTSTLEQHQEMFFGAEIRTFEMALLKFEEIKTWEMVLKEVGSMKGFDTRNQGLAELTKLIVEEVCRKLWTKSERKKVPDDYFGIDGPMEHIMKLLDLDAKDVRFVTIHGIAGVGKTTLVRLVFNKISSSFQQGAAFLLDICEKSRTAGIVNLQEDLISQLLKEYSFDFSDADQGVNMIKERLKGKKVLIILDDIDNSDQLLKLAAQPSWFGVGSRIIITTRNIKEVPELEGFYRYKMQEMNFEDAVKLFSRRAFERDSPPERYDEISREAVHKILKVPLTINVTASLFRDKYARKVTIGEVKKEVHEDEAEETTSRTPSSRKYDVFLNFQGPDSRSTVVDVLYNALVHAGVRVFYDDDSIRKEEVLGEEIKEAIANSTIYIPIFSRNYASSKWCLRELAEIMKYWNASKVDKTILPIFYDVDPRDVALKSEVYNTALREHKKVFAKDKDVVEPWEMALKEVARFKGWDIRNHGLHGLVECMVEEVRFKLWTGNNLEKVIDDQGK